jgi:murein DD-endopeptidase MepM/ murein hydrolase activator NlpD
MLGKLMVFVLGLVFGVVLTLALLVSGAIRTKPALAWSRVTAPIVTSPPVADLPPAPRPSAPNPPDDADRLTMPALHLAMPIAGIDPAKLQDDFNEIRDGGKHDALDILSPRGTPVLAVAEGNVRKLFTSKKGGLTVYQFDDSETYSFYYAHLDRYAPGLKENTLLRKGDVLGYVGSTGNAPANAPHLHFAVNLLGPDKNWWQGTPIDPLPLLR